MPEQPNDSYKAEQHQLWLEAHYALGKLEVSQGFTLDWRGRSAFIKDYIANRTDQVTPPSSEIESDKANNK